MLVSAGDSTDPSSIGGSATIAAGTASASSAHSYIQILGTDANGASGDINLVSTGRVLIQAPLEVIGGSTLGSTQAASLQVLGSSSLGSTQAASLQVLGGSTIGTTASDTFTVNAVATFTSGSTLLYGGSGVLATSAILEFQRRLSTSAVTTGTLLGQVRFTGWDGAVYGLGAQIRSVFTVSLL